MKNLLICVFLAFAIFLPDNGKSQQLEQPPWYVVVNLNLGYNFANPSSDFFNVYSDPNSIPRPSLNASGQWPEFEPSEQRTSWGGELAVKLHNKLYAGILGQRNMRDLRDEFVYTAVLGSVNGDPLEIPGVNEQHHFRHDVTHILAFVDYRLFAGSALSPVIGIGAGFSYSSMKWNWRMDGRGSLGGGFVVIEGEDTFLDIENERNFAFQPRFRLEYNFGGSGFLNAAFVQTDYIFSGFKADLFEDYRNRRLNGEAFESLPQALQTDAVHRLYEEYEVNPGGFQVSFGLSLKLAEPE